MTAQKQKLVTLACNGAWQAVCPAFQFEGRTGDFVAFESRFVVRVFPVFGSTDFVDYHGRWEDREEALKFARTCERGSQVIEVAPYWYAPAFGRVD